MPSLLGSFFSKDLRIVDAIRLHWPLFALEWMLNYVLYSRLRFSLNSLKIAFFSPCLMLLLRSWFICQSLVGDLSLAAFVVCICCLFLLFLSVFVVSEFYCNVSRRGIINLPRQIYCAFSIWKFILFINSEKVSVN